MITESLPLGRFFERARPETPPVLFIVPIVFAVLFLSLIDLVDRAALLLKWPAGRR